jgi:hypothetical protein
MVSWTPTATAAIDSPSTKMTSNPNRSGRCSRCKGRPAERLVATTGAVTSTATATTQAAYRAGPDTIAPANHNPAAMVPAVRYTTIRPRACATWR